MLNLPIEICSHYKKMQICKTIFRRLQILGKNHAQNQGTCKEELVVITRVAENSTSKMRFVSGDRSTSACLLFKSSISSCSVMGRSLDEGADLIGVDADVGVGTCGTTAAFFAPAPLILDVTPAPALAAVFPALTAWLAEGVVLVLPCG